MNVIIGAGPAGISAAYHLKKAGKPFLIIEKEDKIGGISSSFELEGVVFNQGLHIFFTNQPYVDELLKDEFKKAGQKFDYRKRSAWVWSNNTFIPFPFQSNLYGLPTSVVKDCLKGLIGIEESSKPPENVKEWILRSFGKGVAEHFMFPYNEKIWAHPIDMLVTDWVGDRIIKPNYDEIIEGALERMDRPYFGSEIAYPEKGGYEEIPKVLARNLDLEHTMIKASVVSIDLDEKIIKLDTGDTLSYTNLISTMPLTHLVKSTKDVEEACRNAASKLKHFGIHFVSFVSKRAGITDKDHFYCADKDVPWHRLDFPNNSSAFLKKRPVFGAQAEVSFSQYKPVSTDGLVDKVFDSIVRMGIFKEDEPIIATDVRTLPLAYCVYTKDLKPARELLLDYYNKRSVYPAGRFGEWLYVNVDNAILRGKAAAEKCSS